MMRKIALILALALGAAGAAQACGDNGAKSGKPDMSKPASPKPAT